MRPATRACSCAWPAPKNSCRPAAICRPRREYSARTRSVNPATVPGYCLSASRRSQTGSIVEARAERRREPEAWADRFAMKAPGKPNRSVAVAVALHSRYPRLRTTIVVLKPVRLAPQTTVALGLVASRVTCRLKNALHQPNESSRRRNVPRQHRRRARWPRPSLTQRRTFVSLRLPTFFLSLSRNAGTRTRFRSAWAAKNSLRRARALPCLGALRT